MPKRKSNTSWLSQYTDDAKKALQKAQTATMRAAVSNAAKSRISDLTNREIKERERNIADAYFSQAPTISNLYNGAKHWFSSILTPSTNVKPVNYITGDVPTPNSINGGASKWILKGASKRNGEQLGDAVLRFLGSNPEYRYATGIPMSRKGLSQAEIDLLDVFERRGIDTSRFYPEDLKELLNLRRAAVRNSLPQNARHSYIETLNGGYDIRDKKGYDAIGNLKINTEPDNRFSVFMVEKLDPDYSGVSRRAYDVATRLANSTGREGLVVGERLLMPEVTTKVYEHYPNKIQIGDYGLWGPDEATAIGGNPVYLLTEPSGYLKAKSDIFDPIIINNRGDMNVLWDKKNLMWAQGGPLVQQANMFGDGGDETPLAYTHRRFPITEQFDLHPYLDPNFTPKDIGPYGDIEYMQAKYDTLPYYNNYSKPDSLLGKTAIVYNDKLGDLTNESVALDALSHGLREQDPVWQKEYLPTLMNAFDDQANYWVNKLHPEHPQEFKESYVDGFVRNMVADPNLKERMGYWDEELQEAAQNPAIHNALTEAYSYINPTQLPGVTVVGNKKEEGGFLNTYKQWQDLPIKERADIMKVAIRNGITNLADIKAKYNEFALGGQLEESNLYEESDGGNMYSKGSWLRRKTQPISKATKIPATSKKSTPMSNSSAYAMQYFINKGLAPHQAAGLVGNLMRESGLNPLAINPGSKAYGLAQWLGARKKKLFSMYGNNPTLQNQLDFVWWELNNTHKNGLKHLMAARNAEEAARAGMNWFEFSNGDAISEMNKWGQDGRGSMRKGIEFATKLAGQPMPDLAYLDTPNPNMQQSQTYGQMPMGYGYPIQQPQNDNDTFLAFEPSNPQAFFAPLSSYETPVEQPVTQPLVDVAEQQYKEEMAERQRVMQQNNNMLALVSYLNNSGSQDSSPFGVFNLLSGS